jgi:hypothetical protein
MKLNQYLVGVVAFSHEGRFGFSIKCVPLLVSNCYLPRWVKNEEDGFVKKLKAQSRVIPNKPPVSHISH